MQNKTIYHVLTLSVRSVQYNRRVIVIGHRYIETPQYTLENINDHKTYFLTFRFSSGEIIYQDEYTVYFSSKDFENNLNKQRYNKNVRSICDVIDIEDYYIHQYHSLDFEEKQKIRSYLWTNFKIDNYYGNELAKQYIDYEIYNDYDSDYINELRKQYINFIMVDEYCDFMIKTHTSYIFDNKSFPSNYSIFNYIFKNNDKLTETNYEITVITSIL